MKRLYRPMRRRPYRLPLEAIDIFDIFTVTLALLIYLAWRYV